MAADKGPLSMSDGTGRNSPGVRLQDYADGGISVHVRILSFMEGGLYLSGRLLREGGIHAGRKE